jgi:hypothetical protein
LRLDDVRPFFVLRIEVPVYWVVVESKQGLCLITADQAIAGKTGAKR